MKLELKREWFENNLPYGNLDAVACNPSQIYSKSLLKDKSVETYVVDVKLQPHQSVRDNG